MFTPPVQPPASGPTIPQGPAEARALVAAGDRITALGKDRLAEIDQWAFELAHEFAPKKDAKGKTCWENPGDEARFERFLMGGAHNPR